MDASVALMNQYAIIAAQFPPLAPTNSTSSSSTNTTDTNSNPDTDRETPSDAVEKSKSNESEAKATESTTADEAGPSTSQKTSSIETLEIDGNIVTIEDIGRNDPSDEQNESVSEVRRRRLERFELRNQDS